MPLAPRTEIDIVVRTHSDSERLYLEDKNVGKAVMGEHELAEAMARYALERLGTAAADQSIQDSLAGLDPADRSLQVTGYEFSGDNAGELDDSAIAAFGPVAGIAAAPERGLIFRRVRDGAVPYDLQLLAARRRPRADASSRSLLPPAATSRARTGSSQPQFPVPSSQFPVPSSRFAA